MTTKDDGGPAFPVTPTDRGGQCAPTEIGMTLRDYFAAHASSEDVYAVMKLGESLNDPCDIVAARYRHADAMLKERAK